MKPTLTYYLDDGIGSEEEWKATALLYAALGKGRDVSPPERPRSTGTRISAQKRHLVKTPKAA